MVRPLRPNLAVLILGLCLALTACTGADEPAELSRDEVLTAYAGQGLEPGVAECVIGLGEREVELAELAPGADVDDMTGALVAEVIASCEDAASILSAEPPAPEVLAFDAGPFAFGDDNRLDFLYTQCEAGDGRACDRLWTDAPIGSEYEQFGVTCGNRPDLLDCTAELVLDDGATRNPE